MAFPKVAGDKKYRAFVDGEIKEVSIGGHDGCVVLVFYPLDFTFVCPTELNRFSDLKDEFVKRGATVLFVSCDSVYTHKAWAQVPRENGGVMGVSWPMIWDERGDLSRHMWMYDADSGHPMRGTVILSKTLDVKHMSVNHAEIGRSVDEILRLIDAISFNEEFGEVCFVDWKKK
ncbi:putative thioredoxin peroxidase [Ordospora pajunii]|uniref:putative thioredoxin peroxidase n=1 Tax=Ordospora pajunii TaxID=3039483 RepID=UPI00295264D2|nr:putative thioredoxin peroxidase [Ordospora pajunii]KAH9411739.1 putative thioredoxin peroxidase [Ordospora pajunii]